MKKLFILILLGFLFVGSTTSVFATKTEEDVIDESIEYNVDDNTEEDNTEENNYKEYFTIMSKMEETRLDEDKLYYQFYFDNELNYDYLKVSFITSSNVFLSDYQTIKMDYKETCNPIDLKFELNSDKIDIDDIPLYSEIKYDELCITAYAYLNDEVVDTQTQGLYLINSIHGIFVSEFSSFYTYDNYIGYLYSNSLIKEERYKLIAKKITELTPVDEEEKYTKKEELKLFRYFDEDIFEIQEVEVESISDVVDKINHYNKCYSSTTGDGGGSGESKEDAEVDTMPTASFSVTRTIDATNNGKQLKIYGYVKWKDIEQNEHSVRNIEVQIMDQENIGSDKVLATLNTDNDGYYSAEIKNKTGIIENGYDIYIRINTKNEKFNITETTLNSLFGNGYYFTTTVTQNVKHSYSLRKEEYNDSDSCGSISIHQALNVGYYYYDTMNNDNTMNVRVVYPHENGTYYIWNTVYLEYNDYCDWDVILHEFGHHVAHKIGIQPFNAGGNHSSNQNLSERYGKYKGVKMAWSEGWATYFSLAAQLYYEENAATISNIAYVGDYVYTDYIFNTNNIITGIIRNNYEFETGYTEGNEKAVTAVLLNLIIDDEISLTHQEIWDIAKNMSTYNFSGFMSSLYNVINDYNKLSRIGYLLEKNNIVDRPIVTKNIFDKNIPETFRWNVASTVDFDSSDDNHVYYNKVQIRFFDENFDFILDLPSVDSTNGYYSVSTSDWQQLSQFVDDGSIFYWCIVTTQNNYPMTGPYLSTINKGYFPSKIEYESIKYSETLNVEHEKVFKYNVNESGNFTFSSFGNCNLKFTIYDTSILDCNILIEEDCINNDFLYSTYLEANKTIYIKVSNLNDSLSTFSIMVTKYKDLFLNTSYNNNISGTNEIWYKFIAPENGQYTFYSTGSIDTYGELFYYPVSKKSYIGRILYNDDAGEGRNFLFTYELNEGQEVYVRIRGYSNYVNGNCKLFVSLTPVIDELNINNYGMIKAGGFIVYKFTASSAGNYHFFTDGNTDTYMNLFNIPVTNRTTTTGSLASNNNGGTDLNASIYYNLSQNQTIFIRIKGYYSSTTGNYRFVVEKN